MKKHITALVFFLFASGTAAAYVDDNDWAVLHVQAVKLYQQKQFDRAVVLEQKALYAAEHAKRPDDRRVATSLGVIGTLYRLQGQYAQAEPFYQRTLEILAATFGPDHPNTVQCRKDLAALYRQMGREADAVALEKSASTPALDAAIQGESLAWLSGPNMPSASPATSSGLTSIAFINHLVADVSVDWVDADGKSSHFATVKAGASYLQNTHVGHVWTVSVGGSVLGTVVAGQTPGHIDISEKSLATLAHGSSEGAPVLYASSEKAQSFLEGCEMHRLKGAIGNGVITIQFVVDTNGKMAAYKILKSSGFKSLDMSAIVSLNRCEFRIEKKDGQPVNTTYTEDVTYK